MIQALIATSGRPFSPRAHARPRTFGLVALSVAGGLLAVSGLGCNVDSYDSTTTGVLLPNPPSDAPSAASAPDPRGFFVLSTDYQSTSVSLVGAAGAVDSPVFINSASAATGLSAPLGGDVVPPTSQLPGNEAVLIDRLPASVLTWVDFESAAVRAQLNVSTGFSANPQDYVPFAADKAYVTRFEENLSRGREPFDRGSDVLIIDPLQPAILGSIDLWPALTGEDPSFLPRPTRALLAGGQLIVLAAAATADYSAFLSTRLVAIDPTSDTIEQVLVLDGLRNCTSLVPSPDDSELAVACNGAFGQDSASGFPDAGIVLVSVAGGLSELRRFGAAELGGEQIGAVAYAGASSLVFTTYGRYSADGSRLEAPDTFRRVDRLSGALDPEPLVQTTASAFSLGDVRCAPRAGRCLLADAETDGGVLRLYAVAADGALTSTGSVRLDPGLGLPPRYIGAY
jgi:hypothetical protein